MNTKKATPISESSPNHSERNNTTKGHGKEYRMLEVFASGAKIHRFQAARDYMDSVLNTTVSDLRNRYGIQFDREWIKIKSREGHPVRVKRYWLSGQSLERAREIVGWRAVA